MLPRLFIELIVQMRLHRRPFAGDDTVNHGVAQGPVWRDLMVGQNAVELRAEPLDAAPAPVVEKMRPALDGDAIRLFERMGDRPQLALVLERAALHEIGIPGRA